MDMKSVSVPEIYKESQDFRFFMNWFVSALSKLQYDTESFFDLYDPLRCPEELLWLLSDTMGFKYDDRLPTSFNRLVLLYFMSMIRNRGSKDGVTLAAETNLAQFNILLKAGGGMDEDGNKVTGSDILYNRLEDTSIHVNSVYVTPHTAEGYIDVVYFSTQIPVDACIEYVRPVGMFLFQHAGVRFDARTKIEVDARLTNSHDIDYLVRMSEANMKKALGRSRSKYKIEGSNVSLDGDQLLAEANAELEIIRNELGEKSSKLVILN